MSEQMEVMPEQLLKQAEEKKESQEQYTEEEKEAFYQAVKTNIDAINNVPEELHRDIIVRFINVDIGSRVAKNPEKFSGLSLYDIATLFIDKNLGCIIADNFENFSKLDHQYIANRIIESGWGFTVVENIKKFHGITVDGLKKIAKCNKFFLDFESIIPGYFDKVAVSRVIELFFMYNDSDDKNDILLNMLAKEPLLVEAFLANRYGIKLVLKYPELDELSKENISLLYDVKKNKGDVEQDTLEFRILVQERLRNYKNNGKILKTLQNAGVDVYKWLNYQDALDFDLGEEDNLSFAERIYLPITRLTGIKNESGEKIEDGAQDTYIKAFRSTLKPYFEQLSKLFVFEDTDALKKDLEKMLQQQEMAKESGDDKKANGIQKGINSLQLKIDHPKRVSAYDRLMGESAAFERAMRFVELSSDALIEQEKLMQGLIENPSIENRKKLIEAKTRNMVLEMKFRQDVASLDVKMQCFESMQKKMLTSLIGEEETKKLLGTFHETVFEDSDHIQSDVSTLQQLIKNETEETASLQGTPMSISVWNRNPDEDLYLGNYTDCCIRIDSDHMGEESTIADYLTDLGIQVVTACDEKKNIPVVAAWSFIGKNKETGEVALVIDNIEANTEYSIPFQNQLNEKLKTYFEDYAKSIGIAKIVQGQSNNDITLFKMDADYQKLGGYNRKDGYYLEGEGGDDDEEDEDAENEDEDWNDNEEGDDLENKEEGAVNNARKETVEEDDDNYVDVENRLHWRKK